MFESVQARLGKKLTEATLIAEWNDQLRETIFQSAGTQVPLNLSKNAVKALRATAPQKLTWRLFDHYASLGQIYAVFESAIIELVEEYVDVLPNVTPAYANLAESLKTSHRVGVGHVLIKWSETQPHFSKIAENIIAAGLADGLRGQSYKLLGPAFLTDSDNYRPDTLNRVFKKIGFDDAFSTIKKDSQIDDFCKKHLGEHTAESYLNKFVSERNEAAHGDVSEIATAEQIKNYARFVQLVVRTYARLLQSSLIKAGVDSGNTKAVGRVIHVFSGSVYGVEAQTENMEVVLGQRLYVGKKELVAGNIQSLRQGKTVLEKLMLTDGLQFGLGLEVSAKTGDILYSTSL